VLHASHSQESLQAELRNCWEQLNIDSVDEEDYTERLRSADKQIHVYGDQAPDQALQCRAEECESFLVGVRAYSKRIKEQILAAMAREPETSDPLNRSLHFGFFVAEALYPSNVHEHMYSEWSHFPERKVNAATKHEVGNVNEVSEPQADVPPRPRTSGFKPPNSVVTSPEPWWNGSDPDDIPSYTADRLLEPGFLPVSKQWFQELRVRWDEFGMGSLPDAIEELIANASPDRDSGLEHNSQRIKELITEIDNQFQAVADRIEAAAALGDESSQTSPANPKRSTKNDSGTRGKIIAALSKHHRYGEAGDLNLEPIGNNKLAQLADVSPSTISQFFKDKFHGHNGYKVQCKEQSTILTALKLLNADMAPHLLARERSPAEGTVHEDE
jgi:hypothetical protein